jgi:adenine-specific DNA-methyltransferase
MEQLLILPATAAQQAPIIERVQKTIAPKQENQTSEVSKTSEISSDADIPHVEAEIDRLVYELYGLTEEEIAVLEGIPSVE